VKSAFQQENEEFVLLGSIEVFQIFKNPCKKAKNPPQNPNILQK